LSQTIRTISVVEERLGPPIFIHFRDERVAKKNEHPRHPDYAVEAEQGLGDQQRHPDPLEQRRDPPHVHDTGAQLLPQTQLQREQRQAQHHRQDEELEDEVGPEVDGQYGETGDVEQSEGAAEAGHHGAQAVRPLPQRTLGFRHVALSGSLA
jgi:hypothetical protein